MAETETMFETPVIAGVTGDAYQAALRALVTTCEAYLDHEDPDNDDMRPMTAHSRAVARHLRDDGFRPRERMSRAEVHRGALERLTRAVDEYSDLSDYDGGALNLRVWEAFEQTVKSAGRAAESYGPGDTTWAPEDDTNPIKVVPVPEPDPSAEPINGVRQGDIVAADWAPDTHRRVLTGPDEKGYVRLSDPRDGAGNFGGYFVPAQDLGVHYTLVPAEGERTAVVA